MGQVLCVGGFKDELLAVIGAANECIDLKDPDEAREYFNANSGDVDAVIMSLRMAGADGLEEMAKIHKIDPDMPVIISTHDVRVSSIVEAMECGAFNYQYERHAVRELPFNLERALSHMRAIRENRRLQSSLREGRPAHRFLGASPSAVRIRGNLERVAASDLPVLITGESGTGKEIAARTVHALSNRGEGDFVAVNCGAFAPNLLEAELFGYVKGAFTGADRPHAGLFEQAHGSTLFLDEIGVTDLNFQVKLLRALEEGEIRRVGDTRARSVDVRIIAASNKDLERAAQEKVFREDLLYRLNVIHIQIPPLRERLEDIPILARHFLDEARKKDTNAPARIGAAVIKCLEQYDWPGNARELRNIMERAALMCNRTIIQKQDLPDNLIDSIGHWGTAAAHGLDHTMAEIEGRLIREALRGAGNNRSEAARRLRIKRTTLIEKMRRLGIA